MQVQIQCDDIVVVLSRVLDQTRRMGIGIARISAAQGTVVLTVEKPSAQLSNTLGCRIELIEGITSVAIAPTPDDLNLCLQTAEERG